MNDGTAKQQIVEKVKNTSNILVTVSRNPSVDELSAALGLAMLLNKMNKHATAVFSGAIPPAITFLDPQKTFENTVDSLRDFIIALNKEKADHLRYKVDGEVVKIFITPYRTTISSDDLEFSQGDYNVELVLALGVKDRDDLDSALSAHGRILHDATVATLSAGDTVSELGSIDWHEDNASSLSEMLVGLGDSLKGDKGLLDEQIATAFLTGIVASTNRFSNNKTSSRVMTVAAQLMAAGANQQLIASKLEENREIGANKKDDDSETGENADGTTDLSEGKPTKLNKKGKGKKTVQSEPPKKKDNDGELTISHESQGSADGAANAASTEPAQQEQAARAAEDALAASSQAVEAQQQNEAAKKAEDNLAQQLSGVAPAAAQPVTPSVADLRKDLAAAGAEVEQAAQQPPEAAQSPLSGTARGSEQNAPAPSIGGTLNATTEQAEQDKRRELESDRNRTILTHSKGSNYVGDSEPIFQSPLNATVQPQENPPMVDSFQEATLPPASGNVAPSAYVPPAQPTATLADIDRQNRAPGQPSHEDARAAVDAAYGAAPFDPAGQPLTGVGAQPLGGELHSQPAPAAQPEAVLPPPPPMPDFSTLPPPPPAPGVPEAPAAQPQQAPAPSGALPPEKLEDLFGAPPAAPQQTQAQQPADPAQFKIPGQN